MKSAHGSKTSRSTLSGELRLRKDPADINVPGTGIAERRGKARINQPFPAKATGIDAQGKAFDLDCVLDNISSTGLYVQLPREMKSDQELSMVIRFVNGQGSGATALLNGQILRDEPQPNGLHGIALAIKEHRFL